MHMLNPHKIDYSRLYCNDFDVESIKNDAPTSDVKNQTKDEE